MKVTNEIINYYQNRKEKFTTDAQAVGYKIPEYQDITFTQLAKIIFSNEPFTINDLGCGLGAFYSFLQRNNYQDFQYTGYDIYAKMVEDCQQLYPSQTQANFQHIQEANEIQTADYTIAAGIFNLKFNTPEYEWIAYILKTIDQMNQKSAKGFAFNILTKYSDKEFMNPAELYYADPTFFFDFCKRNYSRNVALLHDYTLYEFTILVRK